MAINETVLEMHFHRALMDLFRSTFGVGSTGQISFYKYSPQKECFVGFDQAWVKTEVSDDQLYNDLQQAASHNAYALNNKYVGYFLQYKVVRRMSYHRKKNFPNGMSKPYGRVSVSTQANETSGSSQHQLLFDLSKNAGALTYYACPSIFDKADLYADADLEKLHLVDVASCPSAFTDNQRHYIYFSLPSMTPTWCSEPTIGVSIGARQLQALLQSKLEEEPKAEAERLLAFLRPRREYRREHTFEDLESGSYFDPALQALTILHVSSGSDY